MATKCFGFCFVALILVLGTSAQCFARLGETEAAIRERYGHPFHMVTSRADVGRADKHLYFRKGDISVIVILFKGRCVGEMYTVRDKGGKELPIDDAFDKAEALLQANSNGVEWQEGNAVAVNPEMLRLWERADGKAIAAVWKKSPSTLQVLESDFVNDNASSEKQAEAGLEGF
jgi:hypothetical protein